MCDESSFKSVRFGSLFDEILLRDSIAGGVSKVRRLQIVSVFALDKS